MAAPRLRFGIGVGPALFSSLWIIISRGNDLYLGVRNITGRLKLSIHGSGICHVALENDYWKTVGGMAGLPDRTIVRWRRKAPDEGPREVVSILFPRDFQVPRLGGFPAKPVIKIPPAQLGMAVHLRLFETYLKPDDKLRAALSHFGMPVGHFAFDDGRSFLISAGPEHFDRQSVAHLTSGKGPLRLFDPGGAPAPGEALKGLSCLAWTDPHEEVGITMVELHGISIRREK